jgi:hypothetical protein
MYLGVDLPGPGCSDPWPPLQPLVVVLYIVLAHWAGGHPPKLSSYRTATYQQFWWCQWDVVTVSVDEMLGIWDDMFWDHMLHWDDLKKDCMKMGTTCNGSSRTPGTTWTRTTWTIRNYRSFWDTLAWTKKHSSVLTMYASVRYMFKDTLSCWLLVFVHTEFNTFMSLPLFM